MVVDESVEAAKPGGKPGGASTHATLVAVIEAIDVASRWLLRGTEGRTVDVKVRRSENLKKVKVGVMSRSPTRRRRWRSASHAVCGPEAVD
jgi:hypothetical protein